MHRLRRETARSDSGLTLIELMVAIVLFGLAATGVAYGLQVSSASTRDSRMRVQASNLAARELEISRNEFVSSSDGPVNLGATSVVVNPHALPGGTAGQPLNIDGSKFTVTRTVEWLPAGTGQSPCDGGSAVTYPSLAVNVKVTWDKMGSTKPVVSNTVLTPPKGTLDMPMGFVAVKVLGANGLGVEALPVTLSKSATTYTRSTAADGCAVFAVSTFGTYTATVNVPGYRTLDGQPSASKNTTVSSGTMQQVPFSYDLAATLTTTMTTLAGWSLPSALPQLSLFNAGLPTSNKTMQMASTGVSTTVSGLWPFSDGYSVWAGGCKQSDPASAGGSRPAQSPLTAGASMSVNVQLAPVTVQVLDSSDLPVVGARVQAAPVSTTGCGAGETLLTLGTTDASGVVRTSLPAGSYRLTVVGRSPEAGAWPTTPSSLPLTSATAQTVSVL